MQPILVSFHSPNSQNGQIRLESLQKMYVSHHSLELINGVSLVSIQEDEERVLLGLLELNLDVQPNKQTNKTDKQTNKTDRQTNKQTVL